MAGKKSKRSLSPVKADKATTPIQKSSLKSHHPQKGLFFVSFVKAGRRLTPKEERVEDLRFSIGLDDWAASKLFAGDLGAEYRRMCVRSSGMTEVNLDGLELGEHIVNVYPVPDAGADRKINAVPHSVQLKKSDDGEYEVYALFTLTVPAIAEVSGWASRNFKTQFWAKIEEGQGKLRLIDDTPPEPEPEKKAEEKKDAAE